jgi:dihydroorotase
VDAFTGKLKPFVWEARKKGVLFDLGHGGYSFAFSQAIPALAEGFLPDAISTDLHTFSMNEAMKDMMNVISKMMALGMSMYEVVKASTSDAAAMIRRPELGHLGIGAEADVAVLSIREGRFGFTDVLGQKIIGSQKLECELTIRSGEVVYDLNGMTIQ